MTPYIESIIFSAPKLYFDGIGQVISLIIQMDCPVAVINFFSAAQIYYTKMAWIFLRIIMDLLNTFFADILRPTQIFIWNKGESQQAVLLLFGENLSTGLDFVEFWVSRSPKLLI